MIPPGLRPQTRPAPEASLELLTEAAAHAYHDALLGGESTPRVAWLYDEWQALVERRIARADQAAGGAS
ncbi:hypothetical protein [Embleya sp. NPDC005971]|uniref:hypothetical protein n=1 Tax=Embleya sp. NPDC005971 TaxID=3156724 RepID=UPI0034008F1C